MEEAGPRILADRIRGRMRIVEDFPRPGVRFRDVTPIVEGDANLFKAVIARLTEMHRPRTPTRIVCIESWVMCSGFLWPTSWVADSAWHADQASCLAIRSKRIST